MKFPIDKCPYCGCTVFRQYSRTTGLTAFDMNSDGTEADNADMYANLTDTARKWWVCANCEKRLFKDSEVLK